MKYFAAVLFLKPELFLMTVLQEKQNWKLRSYLPLNGLGSDIENLRIAPYIVRQALFCMPIIK